MSRSTDRRELAELAREWGSYPRLLEGLCCLAEIPVRLAGGGRRTRTIAAADVRRLRLFLATYRRFLGASKGWRRCGPTIPSV